MQDDAWRRNNARAAAIKANSRYGGAAARRQAPAAYETAMLETPKEPKSRRNPGESAMVSVRTNPPNCQAKASGPSMQEQAARWSKRGGGCDRTLTLGHSMGVSRAVISDVIGRGS
jgi:hypothetical protein